MKEEVKERIREQRRLMRKEVEKLKREFIKKEGKWREKRKDMMSCILKLEKRVEGLKKRKKQRESKVVRGEKAEENVEIKVRRLQRELEWKDRKDSKNNIIIRGLEMKEGGRKEAVRGCLSQ